MTECKYTHAIDNIRISQDDKRALLQNLYEQQQQVQEQKVKAKKKKLWISLTSVSTLAVFVALFFVLGFGVQVFHFYIVNNPIGEEMREYLTTTTKNAQYLPNIYLLAGSSGNGGTSDLSLASDSSDGDSVLTGQFQSSDMTLDLDDYREISNRLGDVMTAQNSFLTVEQLKEEIKVVTELIPGYNQWFRFPRELPHMYYDESRSYISNMYYVTVDEENSHITVINTGTNVGANAYDIEKGKYYIDDEYIWNNYIKSSYSVIEFYIDEEGREVVECTFNTFYCINGKFYPLSTQVLKNVKDTSTTKLDIKYTVEHNLKEVYPYRAYFGIDKELDEVFVIQDNSKYGVEVEFLQLDYTDENDIKMLHTTQFFPNDYNSGSRSGYLVLYDKSFDDVYVYGDVWCYSDEIEKLSVFQNPAYYSDKLREYVSSTLSKTFYYRYYCPYCAQTDFADSDVVECCSHSAYSDNISANQELFITSSDALSVEYAREIAVAQFEKMYSNIFSQDKSLLIDESKGDYAFEYSVDDYMTYITHTYVDGSYDLESITDAYKYAKRHFAQMSIDRVNEVMIDKVLYISNVENNNSADSGIFSYDLEVTVSNADFDKDKQYYLALYLDPVRNDTEILDIIEVDLEQTRVYSMKGSFTTQDLLDTCSWKYGHSSYNDKELKVGLVSFDENGQFLTETPGRELIFHPMYFQKYYDKGEVKSSLGMLTLTYEIDVATEFSFRYWVK